MNRLDALDWMTIIDSTDSAEIKKIEEELATINLEISRAERQVQNLLEALVTLSSPAKVINDRLVQLEATAASQKAARVSAERRLEAAKSKRRDLTDQSILYAALSETKDIPTRAKLRQEIRRKVARIDIHFGEQARSFMGAEGLAKVRFTNGVELWIAFGTGLAVLVHPYG